jgi:hypothetical protein
MTALLAREQKFVVDDHVVRAILDEVNRPESISLELVVDGRRLRGWEEPGWRDIGFGAALGTFYWWSARRVVCVVFTATAEVASEITYDEDVLLAFLTRSGLLIVGETSVSVVRGSVVVSRVELDDVIDGSRLEGDQLVIETMDGRSVAVVIESDGLRLRA